MNDVKFEATLSQIRKLVEYLRDDFDILILLADNKEQPTRTHIVGMGCPNCLVDAINSWAKSNGYDTHNNVH